MAALFQDRTKFRVVIDFTVEDNPHSPIFVAHGLVSPGYINNTQPPEPQRDRAKRQAAFVVRPTMPKDVRHRLQVLFGKPPAV